MLHLLVMIDKSWKITGKFTTHSNNGPQSLQQINKIYNRSTRFATDQQNLQQIKKFATDQQNLQHINKICNRSTKFATDLIYDV